MGLATDENHLVFRWIKPDCKVLFSAGQKGNAMSCHFASDKRGLRRLRQAINEFCVFVFYAFPWCRMILATVNVPSVARLLPDCDFEHIGDCDDCKIFMRLPE